MKRQMVEKFLGFTYTRIGYVETLAFLGYQFYFQCGTVRRLFGIEWRVSDES